MKLLVIGSKGFIGSHVFNYFKSKGEHVFGCDVVTDYAAKDYFLIDISNSDYKEVFKHTRFDICINCSGAANVYDSIKNTYRDFALNTVNVFKMLEAIRQNQPDCKFINFSSAAVYGNPKYLPIDEKHPLEPVSPYGFHKLQSESILSEYSKLFDLKTCNLRVFSAFGPGLMKQLFWDLYKKTKGSSRVELFGTGKESRDFIYIDDLLQVVELVIKNNEFRGQAINVANGRQLKIGEAVGTFFELYDSKRDYCFTGNKKEGDPLNWQADISELKSLGYQQKVSFNEGIKSYIKWLKDLK